MVQEARRVIGYAGAFPPYKPLIQKFEKAGNFDEAFALRPRRWKDGAPAALIEQDLEINPGRISKNLHKFGGRKHWQENNLEHFLHQPQ
jgi:hypothetical protein